MKRVVLTTLLGLALATPAHAFKPEVPRGKLLAAQLALGVQVNNTVESQYTDITVGGRVRDCKPENEKRSRWACPVYMTLRGDVEARCRAMVIVRWGKPWGYSVARSGCPAEWLPNKLR